MNFMGVKFGIIAVDYEGHVPRDGMVKGLKSLSAQTYGDFDIFICHDGEKSTPYSDELAGVDLKVKTYFLHTSMRMNNWGHSSRDAAMRFAYANTDCEYYIHFNIDNYLFPNALEAINDKIESTGSDVVVFSINHYKPGGIRVPTPAYFTGVPPIQYNIDAMQMVAHRDVWARIGFWSLTYEQSDGEIYEHICSRNRWEHIAEVLGNNY